VCEVEGTPSAPPFFPPDAECDCADPLAFELQGSGFLLDPLSTVGLENGEFVSTSIEGVIKGCPNTFMQELTVTGTTYTVQLDKTNLCGSDEFTVQDCPVTVQIILTGDCSVDNPIQTVTSLPATVTFNIEGGPECVMTAEIVVNSEGINCCQGYMLTTTLTPPPITPGTDTAGSVPGEDTEGSNGGGDTEGSGSDIVGTGEEISGGGGSKEIVGEDFGTPITPLPPETEEPEAPEESPAEAVKQTAMITDVIIDDSGNITIVGADFLFEGESVVAGVLINGEEAVDITDVTDSTITGTINISIPPGEVTVQLLLECPPGLSNIVDATIPPPVTSGKIESFDAQGPWSQVAPANLTVISSEHFEGSGAFRISNIPAGGGNGGVVTTTGLDGLGAPPWDFSSFNALTMYIVKEHDPGEAGPNDFITIRLEDGTTATQDFQIPIPGPARFSGPHTLDMSDWVQVTFTLASPTINMGDITSVSIFFNDNNSGVPLAGWIDCLEFQS